jgi:hypothetical protein
VGLGCTVGITKLVAIVILVMIVIATAILIVVEGEEVHEIADRRSVFRHILVLAIGDRVRPIVATPRRNPGKTPVLFDELQHRDVIIVGMIDMAFLGVGRNCNERNARAVAEEIERLDKAGIVVAAAFVGGDEDRRRRPQRGIALHVRDQLLQELLVEIGGRVCRMASQGFERTDEGDGRQRVILNVVQKRTVILQLRFLRRILHDARIARERIADAAVEMEQQGYAFDRVSEDGRITAAVARVLIRL